MGLMRWGTAIPLTVSCITTDIFSLSPPQETFQASPQVTLEHWGTSRKHGPWTTSRRGGAWECVGVRGAWGVC